MLTLWIGFIVVVLLMLVLDLGVFHGQVHVISIREALIWSVVWTIVALLFNLFVYYLYQYHWWGVGVEFGESASGAKAAHDFFVGYLLERSLSFDNLFVIAVIFGFFGVASEYQHRALFWGIVGALVMRGVMIGAATWLIHHLWWMTYVFGLLLIATAIKMLMTGEDSVHPDRNPLVRLARRFYPVTSEFHGARFFTRVEGRRAITPLFLALLVIETTDLLFAVDSIPAILAVTTDTFLVFTSNILAILGLRALYFALLGMMRAFEYLKFSLVIILVFVGVKMLMKHHAELPEYISLPVIGGILAIGVVASLIHARRKTAAASPEEDIGGGV